MKNEKLQMLNRKEEELVQSLIASIALLGMTVCFCLLIILNFVIVPIEGTSMLPGIYSTLPDENGDVVKAYTFLYKTTDVGYNDIIVIENSKGKRLIKRVIGLPGDTVSIRDTGNGIYLFIRYAGSAEDICVDESSYIRNGKMEEGSILGQNYIDNVKVPEGCIYVMGDNRDVSQDSRFEGPLKSSQIVGKAVAVYDRPDDEKPRIQFFFRGFEHKPLAT